MGIAAVLMGFVPGSGAERTAIATEHVSDDGGNGAVAGGLHDAPPRTATRAAASEPGRGIRAVFGVGSTADTPDAAPGNGICADAGGACTLRAAIMEANALAGAHTINLPAGTYTLTRPGFEDDAISDDLDIQNTVSIVGAGAGVTIVDGNGQFRVFDVRQTGAASLSNLTVQNGQVTNGQGAGIRNLGTLTLQGVSVINNAAMSGATVQGNGGGIQNALAGTVTAADSLIGGNRAVAAGSLGAFGGGIFNSGITGAPSGPTSQMVLTNTVVTNNSASNTGGGIHQNQQGATLTVRGGTISNNSGSSGGGIATGGSGATVLTLDTSTVSGNSTTAGSGGGIGTFNSTVTVTIDRGTIANNTSATSSGGMSFGGTNSVLALTHSTLTGNRASNGNGGGIAAGAAGGAISPGQMTITNTTISGNSASGGGGGIATSATTGVVNSTIDSNTAGSSGGAFTTATGALTLRSTIVSGNTAPTGANCQGLVTSQGGNIDSGSSCRLTGPFDSSLTDPLLGPLANNGGPTQTRAPLTFSPTIDTALNAGCPALDQRGAARPVDGDSDGAATCDVGAVEAPPNTTPPAACTPRPRVNVTVVASGPGRIQATIAATGTNNRVKALRFVAAPNTLVDYQGQEGRTGEFSVGAGLAQQITFFVRRAAPGAATARIIVVDRCGESPTFVGLGPAVP